MLSVKYLFVIGNNYTRETAYTFPKTAFLGPDPKAYQKCPVVADAIGITNSIDFYRTDVVANR